ncbi:MAG: glycoside hydrolase family 36 protein, partial [Eubacteriales bacterium]
MTNPTTPVLSRFSICDMEAAYLINKHGEVGLQIIPASMADRAGYRSENIESLVQLYIRGDQLPGGFINGLSLSQSGSTYAFRYDSQTSETTGKTTVIRTRLTDGRQHRLTHILTCRENSRAVEIRTVFENLSDEPVVLEYISSFSFGGLTPFGGRRDTDKMKIHRAKSWWSAEGRIETSCIEDMHLEPSWSGCGIRTEKFGQVGSMPVRHWFPFAAVEDESAKVTWAVQLACPSSWQMELRRQRDSLSITGGLADYDFGHWKKTLNPGEKLETPSAILTVGMGGLDEVSQRLTDLHPASDVLTGDDLPVVFNEFCTTWGNPNEDNIRKIVDIIRDKGFDYFVIDCGWYCDGDWGNIGDWRVNESRFPRGLEAAVKIITDAGLKPGIWFEAENCSRSSDVSKMPGYLLTRHSTPICAGSRMFLSMTNPEVRQYLREKVIDFLKQYGFKYIKIDYNDSIGLGCDHPDGLGEGLRQNMLASQEFFSELHREIPGLAIECCSSGGHRLEPSMMALSDMASFSDAHECIQIPIIAANLHRLIRPEKSQIWAVLRKTDSLRRINYSMVNTLLGVMCVSGDVYDLSAEQWEVAGRAIAFYKKYSPIIKNGVSAYYGTEIHSYNEPEGWQAVVRRESGSGRTLLVLHTFGGDLPEKVHIPVSAKCVTDVLCSEGNTVALTEDGVEIELKANFEAVAVV